MALNTELGVYFESQRYSGALANEFDEVAIRKGYRLSMADDGGLRWVTIEHGEQVILEDEPETSFWKRFSTGFLSIFVPESQL